jgi:hypothetical protein
MTSLELRSQIHKAIDNAPENVLPEILDYINIVQHPSADREKLKQFIDKVFQEDDGLLRRLAQ